MDGPPRAVHRFPPEVREVARWRTGAHGAAAFPTSLVRIGGVRARLEQPRVRGDRRLGRLRVRRATVGSGTNLHLRGAEGLVGLLTHPLSRRLVSKLYRASVTLGDGRRLAAYLPQGTARELVFLCILLRSAVRPGWNTPLACRDPRGRKLRMDAHQRCPTICLSANDPSFAQGPLP